MIYVGIDDTDIKDSPGTNKLARWLIQNLRPAYRSLVAVRHQLLFDPRIPYTSKNSSAALLFEENGGSTDDLIERIRDLMRQWFIEGSDPGLCVAQRVPEEVTAFGLRCQSEIVSQDDARNLARQHGIHLEGLGGTEGGVIGALAAVGLIAGGNDGRVVSVGDWPDDLSGRQDVSTLLGRGVAEIRRIDAGERIVSGSVDIGKHLRPSFREGRVVLFVEGATDDSRDGADWKAVRLT